MKRGGAISAAVRARKGQIDWTRPCYLLDVAVDVAGTWRRAGQRCVVCHEKVIAGELIRRGPGSRVVAHARCVPAVQVQP